jgi:hypothetical protein
MPQKLTAKFTTRKPKSKSGAVAPLKQPETRAERPKELGGPSGPEPTRYGDWERKGICVDF